ncbi:MAG: aldehyde dehydrogenase family protein [Pseudomonadota bacterium]
MQHADVKRNLIDGVWSAGVGATDNRNPSDLEHSLGQFAQGTAADVDAAVAAARRAQPAWGRALQLRADVLERAGRLIEARRDVLGRLLSAEEGKTLAEGVGEVNRAAQLFKFFAGEVLRTPGEALDSVRPGVDVEIRRQPLGVVGLITPWNFPIAIPAWKIAPALAYGNAVVIKPADLTPASVHALAEILVEAGVPAGVFNLVMGRGRVVGEALVDHPGLSALSFTGSVDVGRGLIAKAAARQLKVQAEMGGKNPMIILNDADLDAVLPQCVNAAFYSTGQRCTAASRFIVERGILAQFTERMTQAMQALRVGHALESATQIGPVVSEAQLANNQRYVDLARQEGATVVGGERLELATRGYYMRPALFLEATNTMRTSREEIFGPCASVIAADDFEHALALANDTAFGLSAGICTRSLKYAREFTHRAEAGLVMVNLATAGVDYHVPFGGRKGSSYGAREQGRYAVEFYTTVKTAYTAY